MYHCCLLFVVSICFRSFVNVNIGYFATSYSRVRCFLSFIQYLTGGMRTLLPIRTLFACNVVPARMLATTAGRPLRARPWRRGRRPSQRRTPCRWASCPHQEVAALHRDAWMRHCEPIDTPRSSSAVSSSQKSLTEGNPWLGSLLVPWGLDGVRSRG